MLCFENLEVADPPLDSATPRLSLDPQTRLDLLDPEDLARTDLVVLLGLPLSLLVTLLLSTLLAVVATCILFLLAPQPMIHLFQLGTI